MVLLVAVLIRSGFQVEFKQSSDSSDIINFKFKYLNLKCSVTELLWQFHLNFIYDDLLGQFMQNVHAHISKNDDIFAMNKISIKSKQ